tara:strand:- start:1196 stop:3166 length:1971 start_codon:yes stop_codon:yes gene_type:complete
MKHPLYLLAAVLCLSPLKGTAQVVTDYSTLPNSPSYESAAGPLRNAPGAEYKFTEARLSDVLQLLADEANISFFSLPNGTEAGDRIVTFTIHASPFLALETLAKSNGIALIYENGIWYLRPETDTQLIGRVYQIQYNSREAITTGGVGGNLGQVGGTTTGGNTTSGIDLQGTTQSFETEPSQLLEDIRELLDIPTGAFGIMAGATSVDALAAGKGRASTIIMPSTISSLSRSEPGTDSGAKVIWSSDSNTLYVVATRQQHQWIEGYLAASDKPQDQIALEVKFVETSRDPSVEFGVDWSGTLADGYDVTLMGDPTDDIPDLVSSDGSFNNATSITNFINPQRLGDFELPTTALLDLEFVQAKIRAFATNSETTTVSYPRMITTNNREVMLRSVVNQPVLAATSSTSLGAGATSTQSITYLPIGTVLNILPKRLGNGKIQLNIALTISSIIGEEIINGNPFPIASSRVYNAPVEVDPGYTVAIGGLDEANWSQQESGIPALRKIPVLGYAFKTKGGGRQRKSLMIMITPNVIDTKNGGLPDEPISTNRVTPHDPGPPQLKEDGTLINRLDELQGVLVSVNQEAGILETVLDDLNAEEIHKQRINVLLRSVRSTRHKIAAWAEASPELANAISSYDEQLLAIQNRLEKMQRRARWLQY